MWCAACKGLPALLLALVAAASPAADSAPPNDTLLLECHAADTLRGTFGCTAQLRRLADAPRQAVELRLQLSCCYLPVGQSAELRYDERERAFLWTGNPEPGTTRQFDIELRSAYNIASPEREIVATLHGADGRSVARQRVVPDPVLGHTDLLDLRLPWPPPVVLGAVLVLDLVLIVAAFRARPRRGGSATFWAVASVLLATLLLLMGNALIEPIRSRIHYDAFSCTLLSKSAHHPQDQGPWFMLQYERNGEPQIAQGAEGAGLFYASDDAERLAALSPGQRLPCWVDPLRPDRAILDRGPHGGAAVALLVLIGLWRSLRRLLQLRRGE